jgi:hypothetical protein
MNRDWQKDLTIRSPAAAASLPPPMVGETGWDILLALHSDRRRALSLEKLASLISAPPKAMNRWLAKLEDRDLVAGISEGPQGELRAILTRAGRQLLDTYLSATSSLQSGAD